MPEMKSSHELFIVLNENGTIYNDKNRDCRIYKTVDRLKTQANKYANKKIAIFTLSEIKNIEDVL